VKKTPRAAQGRLTICTDKLECLWQKDRVDRIVKKTVDQRLGRALGLQKAHQYRERKGRNKRIRSFSELGRKGRKALGKHYGKGPDFRITGASMPGDS